MSRWIAAGLAFVLLLATPVQAAPIGGLYVFGDSLSDPGNNAILFSSTASPPSNVTLQSDITSNSFLPTFPYAVSYQYSNGDVWAYDFAARLGLPAQVAGPVLGGGLGGNYAFGGATTGPLGNTGVPSLLTQASLYVSSLGSGSAPADALFVIAGGGNNARAALAAISGGADAATTIAATSAQFAADIGEIVDSLQGRGASNLIVWDVPNVGRAPFALVDGALASALATTLARSMNEALALRLAGENGVRTFDVFGLLAEIDADPASYGLTNTTDAGGAVPGADLSTYLYWDGIHPTAAGHSLIAASMYAFTTGVPEIDPAGGGSVVAFVAGCLGLLERRRPRSPAESETRTSGWRRSRASSGSCSRRR